MSDKASLHDMVGEMIMTGFHGNGIGANEPEFRAIESQIHDHKIGGVILFDIDVAGLRARGTAPDVMRTQTFSSNIQNLDQVTQMTERLQRAANGGLFIAVDQEGGTVARLKPEHGFAPTPAACELSHNITETYNAGLRMGMRLRTLGINVNFAPVLDVNINPNCPIIGARGRAFSSDAERVTQYAGAFGRGMSDAGIAYAFKHFPGHGSATTDSHRGVTDITATWRDAELTPYRKILPENPHGAMVMVGHLVNRNIDTAPSSLSAKTINMARQMGFDGVIVSDDLNMGALANEYSTNEIIFRAISAGNDILIFGNNLKYDANMGADVHTAIMKMVESGRIPSSRIYESYVRIMKLKKQIGLER